MTIHDLCLHRRRWFKESVSHNRSLLCVEQCSPSTAFHIETNESIALQSTTHLRAQAEGPRRVVAGALEGAVRDRVPGDDVHMAPQVVAPQQHCQLLSLGPVPPPAHSASGHDLGQWTMTEMPAARDRREVICSSCVRLSKLLHAPCYAAHPGIAAMDAWTCDVNAILRRTQAVP